MIGYVAAACVVALAVLAFLDRWKVVEDARRWLARRKD